MVHNTLASRGTAYTLYSTVLRRSESTVPCRPRGAMPPIFCQQAEQLIIALHKKGAVFSEKPIP